MAKKKSPEGMSEDTKSIIVVLALLFAYPIGVVVMWFMVKWPKWVKIVISLPMILLPLLGILAAAVLITLNPVGRFEKAQRAECIKTCQRMDASNSACVSQCVADYKKGTHRRFYVSPTPFSTSSPQY